MLSSPLGTWESTAPEAFGAAGPPAGAHGSIQLLSPKDAALAGPAPI